MNSFYEELRITDTLSDEKENMQSRKNIDKWIFRILLIILGITPIIVFANIEEVVSPLISDISVLSSGVKGELFTHFKTIFTVFLTVIVSFMFIVKVCFMNGTIKRTYLNYILAVFVVAIIVSTVFSPNITIALNGQYNRSDGAISWLCYIALLFIAMNIEYPKNFVRYIMYTMLPFIYINLYIIIMNFYDMDLLQKVWIQKLVSITLPEGASISEGSELVGTLNQWNYMSGMFAIMVIMYLAWAITSKNIIEMIIASLTAVTSMAIVFMSISTSGFLTILVSILIIFIGLFKVKNKKNALLAIGVFILFTIPIFHFLAEKDYRVWDESIGFLVASKNPYLDESISYLIKGKEVYASDGMFKLPELPEKGDSAGSGRLYIWNKTTDLIGERLFLGYGADSLMYNFPHYNIDARAGIKSEHFITDKAHSQYVGSLYNFGLLGLLAFVILSITSVIITIRSINAENWGVFVIGIASVTYFIQALFNDSLPGVTQLAFILLGIIINTSTFNKKGNIINE